ncbi:MAG: AzlD domain-containing protein [Spirochaetaceae bacterium]|jgi:branched-subunit amino acid transport protein AzlD|nr:AzlD domain-containing protein [Spirochaetaceae bacterium]
MLPLSETVIYTFIMGAVIFFCRAIPFIFFGGTKTDGQAENKFLLFIEKTAPPVAMTVLCFNALTAPIKENPAAVLPVILAAVLTAMLHIWKRNVLLSIFSGTALFMILQRFLPVNFS